MSTINVRGYKGPVRPDGTPIELPQKVLKLTKKSTMRHKKPNRSRVGDFLVGLLLFTLKEVIIGNEQFGKFLACLIFLRHAMHPLEVEKVIFLI